MPYSPPQHRAAFTPKPSEHKRIVQKEYNRTARRNQSFYESMVWRRTSRLHKRLNPLCIRCKDKGIAKPVQITDHITPIEQGGSQLSMDNLQSLCIACHNTKTAEDTGRAGQKSNG